MQLPLILKSCTSSYCFIKRTVYILNERRACRDGAYDGEIITTRSKSDWYVENELIINFIRKTHEYQDWNKVYRVMQNMSICSKIKIETQTENRIKFVILSERLLTIHEVIQL